MMKQLFSTSSLLIASSLVEVGAGLALCCVPQQAMLLLTGTNLDQPAAAVMARMAGAAVIALGIACYWGRSHSQGAMVEGLLVAMTFYNAAAVAIFVWAGLGAGLQGLLLWPAVILHSVMLGWCLGSRPSVASPGA